MRAISILYIILVMIGFMGCNMSDEEKLKKILNSDDMYIQLNISGGIGGYSVQKFHLKKGEIESLLIINEGTDYQTFVRMEDRENLLKLFIQEAVRTNKPDREMSNSCVTGVDSEYILKSGFTVLKLRPDKRCDSIFELLINKN